MGGKHKQAQRTKNNARPSNSGRSAELLGSTIPQFTGFSRIKETPYVFPSYSLVGMDDIDTNIDTTFQLVLKKMGKKDSITKLKALQEFTGLVTSSEQEAVKAILVFWTRIYCVLATDTEHKVREATQLAHYQVVLKVKRNLAPYLKQLIGPWFTSQYDTYAPAASAAIKSIEDAFPKNKNQEAIVFCQEEILNYIYENLMVHTAQSLNVSNVSKEDANAKYERVVISSLQGYALYLNKVDREQIEKVRDANMKIISNQAFWKFYKDDSVPIRIAWYTVLKSLCQKVPCFLNESARQTVNTVLQNLDESEPTVLFAVWEALLLVVTTVENWWTYISIEKLLLPKLYKALREAGQGNATLIFPNLLPLISHLPPNVDVEKFYFNFFDNLQTGLKLKNTLASRLESTAICVTYRECLQYIIMKNESNVYLCEKLIKTELLPVIEWGLVENDSAYKSLFNQISNLVQYWHRNRNEKDFPHYGKYLDYFWHNIESLFEGLLMNQVQKQDKNALSELALKQIEFLLSLKHISKPKKLLKVQFSESGTEGPEHGPVKAKDEKCDESYMEALNALVFKICKLYVDIVNDNLFKELVEHLYSIIIEFENRNFFLKLNELINSGGKLTDLYDNLLSKWLNSFYICSESVVGLVFVLLKYIEREEKLRILESFESLPMERFGWCLQSALSHPYNQDVVIHEWLSNPKVDEYLIKIADNAINSKGEADISNLLKMAFTEGDHGELFVSNNTVERIVQIIIECLRSPLDHAHSLDITGSFAAYLCSILYTESNKLKYGTDLLVEIFKLLCYEKYDKETLTKDTIWEMQTSVYDSIEILCGAIAPDRLKEIIGSLSEIIERKLFDAKRLDIDAVFNLIMGLVKCVRTSDEQIYTAEVILEKEFINEWREKIVEIVTVAEYVNGNLSSPTEKIKVATDVISLENVLKFSDYLLLRAKVFSTCPAQFNLIFDGDDANVIDATENIEPEVSNDDTDDTLVIESSSDDLEILGGLLHDYTLLSTFIENYKTTNVYDHLTDIIQICFDHIDVIVKKLDDINEYLLMKIERNWLWEKTIFDYNVVFKNQSKSGTYKWYTDRSKLYNVPWKYIVKDVAQNCRPDTESSLVEELVNFRNFSKFESMERVNELFTKIEEFKSSVGEEFYVLNFSQWSDIETSIEIVRFCTEVFDNFDVEELDDKHWDFVAVSLASWSLKMPDIQAVYKNIQIQAFMATVCDLFSRVETYLRLSDRYLRHSKEWCEVFAEDVHTSVVEIWMYLTEQVSKDVQVKTTLLPFLQHVGCAICHLNHAYIFNKADSPASWSKIIKQCCTLLVNQSSVLQLWGYDMLKVLKPGLVEMDVQTLKSNVPNEKGLIFEKFKSVLQKTQEIVHILLSAMKLGEDSCRVQPHTDSFTYTFAYTLLWDFLLMLCEAASTDLRFQYAEWLKNQGYLSKLLVHLFKLMPGEVLFYVPSESKVKPFYDYFTKKFQLSMIAPTNSATLERIVCWVFFMTLSQLPASVRQWWTDSESRSSQVVERVTAAYVSPQLCGQELQDVAQHETKFRNMVIKIHPTVREVIAIYTVDDVQMDLVITLPTNFPLVGPDVQCNKQIAGTSHKNWLMQLKKCLRYQNGRIWDGLSLWNNSLNKKFDGVEECYICFAVLHQGTYQLPKLSCQTCRKKFHSACLYKWFSTSNKSTCPICRNLF